MVYTRRVSRLVQNRIFRCFFLPNFFYVNDTQPLTKKQNFDLQQYRNSITYMKLDKRRDTQNVTNWLKLAFNLFGFITKHSKYKEDFGIKLLKLLEGNDKKRVTSKKAWR